MKNNKQIFTSANIITIIRICFVPLFVCALLTPWPRIFDPSGSHDYLKALLALIIFAVLSFTDSIDGYLARSRNEVTDFGKFMDPLADKILVFAALISLVELSILPTWVVLIILIREFIVSGLRMLAASKGVVIAASWYGKAKTVTQIISILLFLLIVVLEVANCDEQIIYFINIAAWAVMIASLVLTIISMIDYIYKSKEVFLSEPSKKIDTNDINSIASDIVSLCNNKNLTLSTAESITAGQISSVLTSISGSSNVFMGGVASYTYNAKNVFLNVEPTLLKAEGAINSKCALSMAYGVMNKLDTNFALSTTGIAGPTSDEFDTPVGKVYIGLCNNKKQQVYEYDLSGNREEIRAKATFNALKNLYDFINSNI